MAFSLLDLKDKLREFLGQGGNAINQGIKNFSQPITAPHGNTQPINWGQIAQNTADYVNPNKGVRVVQPTKLLSPISQPLNTQYRNLWTDLPQLGDPNKIIEAIPGAYRSGATAALQASPLGPGASLLKKGWDTSPISKSPLGNILSGVANDLFMTPANIAQGSARATAGVIENKPQKILGGVGQAGSAFLNVLPVKVLGKAGTVIENLGKMGVKQAALGGVLSGALFGATSGFGKGLEMNMDKSIGDQLKEAGLSSLVGAALGSVVGGGLGAGGSIFSQWLTKKPADFYWGFKQLKPTWNEKQLRDAAGKFAKEETIGLLTGKQTLVKDKYITDAERSALRSYYGLELSQPGMTVKRLTKGEGVALRKLNEIRNQNVGASNQGLSAQNTQSQIVPTAPVPPPSSREIVGSSPSIVAPGVKKRGLVTSVGEAPNISSKVKKGVSGTYTVKPNSQLMGEAQALLNDGASIDFKNTQGLDKKVAATIKEAINLQKQGNHEAAANLYNNLSEHATELGRGVQAFSLLDKMSPEAVSLTVAGKIRRYNAIHSAKIPELTGEQTKIIADKVAALDGLANGSREKNIALNELNKTINSFIPSSITDKAIAVWKAGLLTSFRTHERNFLGNLIHGTAEVAKDPFAVAADKVMSLKTGERTKTFTLQGLGEFGSKNTRQQMADIITKGYDPSQQVDKFDYRAVNWGNNRVEQTLKKYTDLVFNTLGASDKPFYNAAMARSLYDQAGAAAINAGKKGEKVFIESIVKNPPEEILKRAIADANVATFKNKNVATSVASAVKRALANEKNGELAAQAGNLVGEVIMPFTGVPSSILGQAAAYSPIGLTRGIINAGRVLASDVPNLQREAAHEIGRGVVGTGVFGLGAYLAGKGLITGQPKDAAEARQWELENKPRNSILINGQWKSLNSIGPESIVLLAGAKFNEDMNNPEKGLGGFAGDVGKDVLDQSFLTGIQQPVNAITDPARYGKSYVGNLLSSPIPNLVKDFGKSQDPYQREANSITDYAKSNIPFVRNTMLPRRDALGNPIPQEPTGINAFIDPFNTKTPVNDSVTNELGRLNSVDQNATPGKLNSSQTIKGVKQKLTPEQLDVLESTVGPVIRQKLDALIQSPGYQRLGDEEKANAIQSVVASTRKLVRGGLDVNNPSATTTQESVDNGSLKDTYTIVNPETGNVKTIDLRSDVQSPTLTGNEAFDKKLISSYQSEINSKINDVVSLYKDGQISAVQAQELVDKLATESSKFKKPKKLPTIKIAAPRQTKIRLAAPNIKMIKIKPLKIKKSNKNTYRIKA